SFMNYAFLGSVDYSLALLLILGTIPGVYLGTHVNTKANKDMLKKIINMAILVIGALILAEKVF
ncbi:MAG: sulfite exporter TauE/SafE family protein, partial [Thermococcus sp.]|nr:sulfite exporter TauE/SafE family protein [Thermococcus sp.]